jgi:predicted aspartyl protease
MTDNEEPRWAKITIRQSVDDLRKHGPTVEVFVTDIQTGARKGVIAQIDTGADGTCISPRLARALALKAADTCLVHQADKPTMLMPYFEIKLSLPLIDVNLKVATLSDLNGPHDILIGRDVLANSRLTVDFTSGVTDLHVRTF